MSIEGQHSERPRTESGGPECIKTAAVIFNGELYTGIMHADALEQIEEKYMFWPDTSSYTAGFLTNTDRFVSREEAQKIAAAADQVREEGRNEESLLAENIKWTKNQANRPN